MIEDTRQEIVAAYRRKDILYRSAPRCQRCGDFSQGDSIWCELCEPLTKTRTPLDMMKEGEATNPRVLDDQTEHLRHVKFLKANSVTGLFL